MRITATVAIFLAVLGVSMAAEVEAAVRQPTSISPQGLGPALEALAKERDFQILYVTSVVNELRTQGASGELTVEEALTKLLEGTGLGYRYLDDKTITVVPFTRKTSTTDLGTNAAGTISNPSFKMAEGDYHLRGVRHLGPAGADQLGTDESAGGGEFEALSEIVVTGSHIRGSAPAGTKVLVIDREEIDRSGYGRLEDLFAALPQNFQGGVGEEAETLSSNTQFLAQNFNKGSEIELRGLGVGATLTLVNGHRQPAGGLVGAYTDVASIPVAAVERVEILMDGASAIYGSDAIGGVVNIILKKEYDGAETGVRLSTAQGDANETQLSQLFGHSWSTGNALIGYQYYERESLPAAERPYSASNGDFRRFGGSDFRTFGANPGTILCATATQPGCTAANEPAFAIPAGQDGTNLNVADLIPGSVNFTDQVTNNFLLPQQEMHSAFLSASQGMGEVWALSLDARYSTREFEHSNSADIVRNVTVPTTNPFYVDAFGDGLPLRVAYDFTADFGPVIETGTTDTYAASLAGVAQLPGRWQLRLSGSYGQEDVEVRWRNRTLNSLITAAVNRTDAGALNVFGDGSHTDPATIEAMRFETLFAATSDLWSVGAIADGVLFDLAGGAGRLAIGADFRDEQLHAVQPAVLLDSQEGRHISAAFAELALPIVGSDNARPGLRGLTLSIAGRYEDYSDFGTTFNPKIGLTWSPLQSLQLRGTWGTSFRAPPFVQSSVAISPAFAFSDTISDPLVSGFSNVLILVGNNPSLKEETATVRTAGFDWQPSAAPGLSLSLTGFDIEYEDKIDAIADTSTVLELEEIWAPIITRDPTQEQIDAICNDPNFGGDCTPPIAAIIDARFRNLAVVRVQGVDLDLRHALDSSMGSWTFGLGGTYTSKYELAVTDTAPKLEVLDTVGHPLSLRLRGSLTWTRAGWTAGAFVNYAGSYENPATDPVEEVDSHTTVDLSLTYRTPERGSWLDNTRVSLTAVNVFDEIAPFVDQEGGYDGANSSVLGRLLGLQVVKSWE